MTTAQAVQHEEPGILKLTFIMTAVTTVAGLILGLVAYITMPAAIENQKLLEEQARKDILPQASVFEEIKGEHGWFTGKDDSGEKVGYVIMTSGKGYGGSVVLTVGVSPDLKVMNYTVTHHNETPGLGDNMKKEKFKAQFRGKKAGQMEITKRNEAGKINAITGATITTKAVVNGIEAGLTELKKKLSSPAAEQAEQSERRNDHE